MESKDTKKVEERKNSKTGLIVAILVLACLFMGWLMKSSFMSAAGAGSSFSASQEVTDEQIAVMLQEHTTEYQRRNRQLLEEFKARVKTIGKEDFAHARSNVPRFVKNTTSFSFCSKMCYRLAVDAFQDSATAMELLGPELGTNIVVPCAQGQEKILDALNDFILKLQENDTQYRAGLAELAKSEEFQASGLTAPEAFWTDVQKLTITIRGNAFDTVCTALGTGLEIFFIRQSLRTISAGMAPLIAKISASLSIGGTAAVADGPLPIGDIIGGTVALGGMAWTAYDLYKITKTLPRKLRQEVTQTIDRAETDMRSESLKYAMNMVKQCETNSSKLIDELTK